MGKEFFSRGRTVCIGQDVSVRLKGNVEKALPANKEFELHAQNNGCTLSLEIISGPIPAPGPRELLFDSTSLWKVFRQDHTYIFELPHLSAVVDFNAGSGRIYLQDSYPNLAVFDYPLDEVIFSKLLADRGSVIVHACGVDYGGRGLLFGGGSGAGKSTLASLFGAIEGAHLLSDDRVALGIRQGRVQISGTPWHGTSGHSLNRTVPLERIFFLRQASANHDEPLLPLEAAARLLSLCVIPYWHHESSGKALNTAVDIVGRVPASDLGFTPDPAAVDHVIHLLDL